ncbi:MAG TPA: LuxR family transcriptional regulator [Paracoccaceae bacterium]|nr:LuxR family transcriptional regulator [Paracoccaceae bacterium]
MSDANTENTVEFLAQMVSVQSAECLWSLLTAKMASYGFDRLIYGSTRSAENEAVGPEVDWVVLSNHSPDYIQRFLTQEALRSAPMMRWTMAHFGAQSWRIVQERAASGQLSDAELRHLEFNKSMQIIAGYTISFVTTGSRQRAAVALTARAGLSQDDVDEIWAQHGPDIEIINNVAHLKIMSLPNLGSIRLSPRQKEILEAVGDGKSAADISVLLGISVAMVEKHLRLARETLDVDTTAQALLKAAFLNQVYVNTA